RSARLNDGNDAHQPLADAVALGNLARRILLSRWLAQVLIGAPSSRGHDTGVLLDPLGLLEQERFELLAVDLLAPATLLKFLSTLGLRWNISLFHYRNHGSAFGRVLFGVEAAADERDELPRGPCHSASIIPRRAAIRPRACSSSDPPVTRADRVRH